jgi:predicted ribosome quality control (RQC) complex YloA/Tae2 family protein
MPARQYILPPAQNKTSLENIDTDQFFDSLKQNPKSDSVSGISSVEKYLLNNIKGFSPLICSEICFKAEINGKEGIGNLTDRELDSLKTALTEMFLLIKENQFSPCIIVDNESDERPIDFHCLKISHKGKMNSFTSICKVLDTFYCEKDKFERLKLKKSDVSKVLSNSFERCKKKLSIHQENLREVADREKFKLYGELITANIYCIPISLNTVSLLNYYSETEEFVDVPMDEHISPQQNAQRYFKKYTKAKKTHGLYGSWLYFIV